MKYYIGTKLIEAEPAERDGKAGYKVRYADDYESWSPADVFERAYMALDENDTMISGLNIGADMVNGFIAEKHVFTMGNKTTVVRAVLKNGFEIVESSSCVDPANYSEKIGAEICMERIANKVWELLGFLLQTAVYGVIPHKRTNVDPDEYLKKEFCNVDPDEYLKKEFCNERQQAD